jgi:DNA sulfur modification protein DndD
MLLRSVELRDWRSYRHARFDFPQPGDGKNVILIMAPNEHGKTSLFEAVTLCLFGREGLPLIPRARAATGSDLAERLNTTYSQFLSATLHRRAIESGRLSCSVTIEMEDDDGEPIELSRKWHFRADGGHKLYDDQLTIYEGVGRRPVAPPLNEEDREGWYRNFIAQRFLPSSLAEFFLFDGEQVQRYANRGMNDQVRTGIEGLLGLPVLRSLKESLDRYAQARRSGAATPSDSVVKVVEAEIAKLESDHDEQRAKKDAADALIPELAPLV